MKQHECRCFRNPARLCPVCERQWPVDLLAEPIAALAGITSESEKVLVQALRDAVESCPACVCSAIAQAPLPMCEWDNPDEFILGTWHEGAHGECRYRVDFNYKQERDEYFREQRAGLEPFNP